MDDITNDQKTWHTGEDFVDIVNPNISGDAEQIFKDKNDVPKAVVWLTDENGPYLFFWKLTIDDFFTPAKPSIVWTLSNVNDPDSQNNGLVYDPYIRPVQPPTDVIKLGQMIRCVSKPHNLDRWFIVKKMSIPLNAPESTSYSLGDSMSVSLSDIIAKANVKTNRRLDKIAKNNRSPDVTGSASKD